MCARGAWCVVWRTRVFALRSSGRSKDECRLTDGAFARLNARRSVVGAPTQFHHELNHGETGKGDPLCGLKAPFTVWPIHGGFGRHFMEVWVRFMEVWIHGGFDFGAPEAASPPGQAHRLD